MLRKYLMLTSFALVTCLFSFKALGQGYVKVGQYDEQGAFVPTLKAAVQEVTDNTNVISEEAVTETIVNPFDGKTLVKQEEVIAETSAPTPPAAPAAKTSSEEAIVSINLDQKSQITTLRFGQLLEIVFDEKAPQEWTYEIGTKTLKFLDANKINNRLVVTFEVIGAGKERLFFDLLDKSDGHIKVIESRLLDINAGM